MTGNCLISISNHCFLTRDLSIASIITLLVGIVPFVILKKSWQNDFKRQKLKELEALQLLINKQNGLIENFYNKWQLNKEILPGQTLARTQFYDVLTKEKIVSLKYDINTLTRMRDELHQEVLTKIQIYFQDFNRVYLPYFEWYKEMRATLHKLLVELDYIETDNSTTLKILGQIHDFYNDKINGHSYYQYMYIDILKILNNLTGDS